jgi:hypothetical protein
MDARRLYGELHNHIAVHSNPEQAMLIGDEATATWCETLKSTIWPSDAWVDSQYAFIDKHKNDPVGMTFSYSEEMEIRTSGQQDQDYVKRTLMEYMRLYIGASSEVHDGDKNPDPATRRVDALIRTSTPVDRAFYVWRGVSIKSTARAETVAWFKSLQTSGIMPLQGQQPVSTTLDSYTGASFALFASNSWEEVGAAGLSAILFRIQIPRGSRGVLPIGRIAGEQKEENQEQEVILPSDAKIRILQETIKRTPIIFNFRTDIGNPTEFCNSVEILTAEAIYEA